MKLQGYQCPQSRVPKKFGSGRFNISFDRTFIRSVATAPSDYSFDLARASPVCQMVAYRSAHLFRAYAARSRRNVIRFSWMQPLSTRNRVPSAGRICFLAATAKRYENASRYVRLGSVRMPKEESQVARIVPRHAQKRNCEAHARARSHVCR